MCPRFQGSKKTLTESQSSQFTPCTLRPLLSQAMSGRASSSLRAWFQTGRACSERNQPSLLCSKSQYWALPSCTRLFSSSRSHFADGRTLETARTEDGKEHDHDGSVSQEKEKQTRTPWHREGSNMPPVSRPRIASAMTKGSLFTSYTLAHSTLVLNFQANSSPPPPASSS